MLLRDFLEQIVPFRGLGDNAVYLPTIESDEPYFVPLQPPVYKELNYCSSGKVTMTA